LKGSEEAGKGIGRALKKDMGREAEIAREAAGSSGGPALFMNEMRREIFRLLCLRPCLHLSGVAKLMGISVPTARWHLKKLMGEKFVARRAFAKKMVHFPTGLLEEEEVGIFSLLNDEGARSVLHHVMEGPGLSQKDLKDIMNVRHQVVMWHAGRLAESGLVNIVGDGRYKRYYPTDLLGRKEDAHRKRIRHFRESLVARLKRDGVEPEVMKTTAWELHLRITSGPSRRSFVIPTRPFRTVLEPPGEAGPTLDMKAGIREERDMHIPLHRSRRSRAVERVAPDGDDKEAKTEGASDGGDDKEPRTEGASDG
jgi:DNA-binding transcriptional ArsR family regulator